MILTNCASCATPLPHLAKQCSRCKTRYCGPACQEQHWKEGGHKDQCKTIKRGAEQNYADNKYKEAIAVAVEACAEDTKGQTCYICLEAVHSRTGEGLVRGCACGDRDGVASPELGVAHVSCFARQAKMLCEEDEENDLGSRATEECFARWRTCDLCKQDYHGVVSCALGWACWKTYVGRSESTWIRFRAMGRLADGLIDGCWYEESAYVWEASRELLRRFWPGDYAHGDNLLTIQSSIATCYYHLGRKKEALQLERDEYEASKARNGIDDEETLTSALNLSISLVALNLFAEAKPFLRKNMRRARRVHGDDADVTVGLRLQYAYALSKDNDASSNDYHEAEKILVELDATSQRVFGTFHPTSEQIQANLEVVRELLADEAGN